MTATLNACDDSALIEEVLAGRTDSFDVLMERHIVALRKCIASMVRNAAEGEDILQDVLLKVWCHLAAFRGESSFRTWMSRVAVNEVLQSYRRSKCRPSCHPPLDLDSFASSDDSALASLVQSDTRVKVRRAVEKLPDIYRKVLVLRDLEELSASETAQRLESTVPAVKSRLFRARIMLSKTLRAQSANAARNKVRLRQRRQLQSSALYTSVIQGVSHVQ
jgi:RNA polymerase sigma-70 factor (ECF subfamily)